MFGGVRPARGATWLERGPFSRDPGVTMQCKRKEKEKGTLGAAAPAGARRPWRQGLLQRKRRCEAQRAVSEGAAPGPCLCRRKESKQKGFGKIAEKKRKEHSEAQAQKKIKRNNNFRYGGTTAKRYAQQTILPQKKKKINKI